MSWDCQCRSSKPETCQLFTQPATYLLNLPTYFPTCKLFSQTCQLFPQPANFLPKPANFFPNLPTFSLNLPTFSQTCQLLSQDLGGDPPPPDGHLSQPCKTHLFAQLGWFQKSCPPYPHIVESSSLPLKHISRALFPYIY